MKKFKLWPTLISLLVVLLTAGIGTLLSRIGMDSFNTLVKPSFQPPDIVFPIAWGIIYLLTFLSAALYFSAEADSKALDNGKNPSRAKGLALYITMAVLNILWVLCVFVFSLTAAGVAVILAYIAVVLLTIFHARKVSSPAAWLLVPHLVWLLFALVLNYALALLN